LGSLLEGNPQRMEVTDLKKLRGLYLVAAPILPADKLLIVVEKALNGGVDIVQFIPDGQSLETLETAKGLSKLTEQFNVPFLINGRLLLAREIRADGLHFDGYLIEPSEARRILGRRCIVGYTVGNDLKKLVWAETVGANYVSFCSIFPTPSVGQCDIVPIETVKAAKSKTALPVFAAGGISSKNAHLVLEAGADGIAVTSAILKAKDPEQAARSLKEIVREHRMHAS